MINVSRPSLGVSETNAVGKVMETGWIGQGEKVIEFEKECRELLASRYFIALSSCTKSIEISFLMSGCKPGDEVLVPSLTYAAVIQIIIKLGLIPVFVDIDNETLNISVKDLESKITARSKFIAPLHFRGHPCNMDRLKEIAAHYKLYIIEDGAHAFGSSVNKQPIGSDSYACCFSFGPLKTISCIEGGGIATNDAIFAEKIINYRNLGMSRSTWQRYNGVKKPWEYEVVAAGDKCNMNDVFAAVGIVQLQRMGEITNKRRKVIENYATQLGSVSSIEIPEISITEDAICFFPVLLPAGTQEAFMGCLLDKGISTAIHYHPNHLQPFFSNYTSTPLVNTEAIAKRMVTLPFYTDLTETEQEYVISAIKDFFRKS